MVRCEIQHVTHKNDQSLRHIDSIHVKKLTTKQACICTTLYAFSSLTWITQFSLNNITGMFGWWERCEIRHITHTNDQSLRYINSEHVKKLTTKQACINTTLCVISSLTWTTQFSLNITCMFGWWERCEIWHITHTNDQRLRHIDSEHVKKLTTKQESIDTMLCASASASPSSCKSNTMWLARLTG